jgi:hypothetical protein
VKGTRPFIFVKGTVPSANMKGRVPFDVPFDAKRRARVFRRGPMVQKNVSEPYRVYEGGQYDLTLSSFLTSFTPVTDLATLVAADLAAALSTKPDSETTPSLVSTLIW